MINKVIILVLICLLGLPSTLWAASDDFTIKTQIVGVDSEAPTTPTLLSVVPIADTQIDINWSASNDNYFLDGYVLFRDSLAIATTTLTSFSDTGLSASTTYAYEVYAFDASGNISTTSNSISTTTLATPILPPAATSTTSTGSSATQVFKILESTITPSINTALFKWSTTLPSRYVLRWGRDDSYDDGYIVNDVYRREHQTQVSGLEPGTTYLYQIIGYTPTGREVQLEAGQFKTTARTNVFPENVRGLRAEVSGESVTLWWDKIDTSGSLVRIVRSHLGFPLDAYDGSVVYEGDKNTFLDRQALSIHGEQFYTVFVINSEGSVSSGAVVSVRKIINNPGDVTTIPQEVTEEAEETIEPEAGTEIDEDVVVEIEIPNYDFSVSNIKIQQGNKDFSFDSESIKLAQNENFIISIPYEALPRNLKSIIVTLTDPTNPKRSYSFLLRINKDRTAYEAIIAPIQSVGISRIQIEIFDFEREVVGRYRKVVNFVEGSPVIEEVVFPDKIIKTIQPLFGAFSLIFLIIILIIFFLYRRSKKDEDKL
jgi:hypothetical protein